MVRGPKLEEASNFFFLAVLVEAEAAAVGCKRPGEKGPAGRSKLIGFAQASRWHLAIGTWLLTFGPTAVRESWRNQRWAAGRRGWRSCLASAWLRWPNRLGARWRLSLAKPVHPYRRRRQSCCNTHRCSIGAGVPSPASSSGIGQEAEERRRGLVQAAPPSGVGPLAAACDSARGPRNSPQARPSLPPVGPGCCCYPAPKGPRTAHQKKKKGSRPPSFAAAAALPRAPRPRQAPARCRHGAALPPFSSAHLDTVA